MRKKGGKRRLSLDSRRERVKRPGGVKRSERRQNVLVKRRKRKVLNKGQRLGDHGKRSANTNKGWQIPLSAAGRNQKRNQKKR